MEKVQDILFDILSDNFENMRKDKEIFQEAFVASGFGDHEEIINWCIEMLKKDEYVRLANINNSSQRKE